MVLLSMVSFVFHPCTGNERRLSFNGNGVYSSGPECTKETYGQRPSQMWGVLVVIWESNLSWCAPIETLASVGRIMVANLHLIKRRLRKDVPVTGACPGFLKGGGSNISWFPKKRSSDFKRGGSSGLKGGSSTFVPLGRQIWHI